MKEVTVRTLSRDLRRILGRVERGEAFEITRRRRRVARLVPAAETTQPEPWPDLAARARRTFGDRVVEPSPSRRLLDDRGEW